MKARVSPHLSRLLFSDRKYFCRIVSRSCHSVVAEIAYGKSVLFLHGINADPDPRTAVLADLPELMKKSNRFHISNGLISTETESYKLEPQVVETPVVLESTASPQIPSILKLKAWLGESCEGMAQIMNCRHAPLSEKMIPALSSLVKAFGSDGDEFYTILGQISGCGPGATPSSDDFIRGVLAGLRLCGKQGKIPYLQLARDVRKRTNRISANMICSAMFSYCLTWQKDILSDLTSGLCSKTLSCINHGHTSDRDFLYGVAFSLYLALGNRAENELNTEDLWIH